MVALIFSALLLVQFDHDLWEHFPKPTWFSCLPKEHINNHQTQYRHLLLTKQVQIKNAACHPWKSYGVVPVFCFLYKHFSSKAQPGSSMLKDSCGTKLLLRHLHSSPNTKISRKRASAKLHFLSPSLSDGAMSPWAVLPMAAWTDATLKSTPSDWQNQELTTCYAQYHFQKNSCCSHWAYMLKISEP